MTGIAELLAFWTAAVDCGDWAAKDEGFDRRFRDRYLGLHLAAAARQHDGWIDTPEGALALMVLLDQYPRNAFRGTGHMYATDWLALTHARDALERGHAAAVAEGMQVFFILPFSHSEMLDDQDRAVDLTRALMPADMHWRAERHRDIIHRFGRFPHRNPILGRESLPEELAYLAEGGFAG